MKRILVVFFVICSVAQAEMFFLGLGDLPGGSISSSAYSISGDGSTIVGMSYAGDEQNDNHWEAFRWSQTEGMIGLGDLSGGWFKSTAGAVSADGSVIVGMGTSEFGSEAFRWDQTSGMVGLGDLSGGDFRSRAEGISADGSVIVGWSTSGAGNEVFRWSQPAGMISLGDLPHSDNNLRGIAKAISADGSTIAGYGEGDSISAEAFRWTEPDGMIGLGFGGTGEAVSGDGSVIVGNAGDTPFRWTQEDGMIALINIEEEEDLSFTVHDVSADGSIIVGTGYIDGSEESALIWDEVNGVQSLTTLLTAGGIDMSDWTELSARGISADGKTITGTGSNSLGYTEAFIAVIPEPSSIILVFVGGGVLYFKTRVPGSQR